MLFTFRFTIPATSPSAYLEARIDQVFVTVCRCYHDLCLWIIELLVDQINTIFDIEIEHRAQIILCVIYVPILFC